jgi:hypothetical protein
MDIKMNFMERGLGGASWIYLAHDRDSCEHSNESLGFMKDDKFDLLSDY